MKKKNVKMKRSMAFLFAIVMLVTQLGIGNFNVYAGDLNDDVETVSSNNQVINRSVKSVDGYEVAEFALRNDIEVPIDAVAIGDATRILYNDHYTVDGKTFVEGAPGVDVASYAYYKDKVLTLHDFVLDDITDDYGFVSSSDIKIVLEGKNVIEFPERKEGNVEYCYGEAFVFNDTGNRKITGDGSLDIKGCSVAFMHEETLYYNSSKKSYLEFDGVRVNIETSDVGIYFLGNLDITNSDINIKRTSYDGNKSDTYRVGICAFKNNLTLKNSNISCEDVYSKNEECISCFEAIHVSEGELFIDNCKIDTMNLWACIEIYKGKLDVNNSKINVLCDYDNIQKPERYGIYATSGTVNLKNVEFYCDDKNDYSNVTDKSRFIGIDAYESDVVISGKSFKATNVAEGISGRLADNNLKIINADIYISSYYDAIDECGYGDASSTIEIQDSNLNLKCIDNPYWDECAAIAANNVNIIDSEIYEDKYGEGIVALYSLSIVNGTYELLNNISAVSVTMANAGKAYLAPDTMYIEGAYDGIYLSGDDKSDFSISDSANIEIAKCQTGIWNANSYLNNKKAATLNIKDANVFIHDVEKGFVAPKNIYVDDKYPFVFDGATVTVHASDNAMTAYDVSNANPELKGFVFVKGRVELIGDKGAIKRSNNTDVQLSDTAIMGTVDENLEFHYITWEDYTDQNNVVIYTPCVVTFDNNGHGKAVNPMNNVYFDSMIELPKMESDGIYDFGGWYKEKECINPWNENLDTVKDDITLYAKWDIRYHDIKIEKIGNGTVTTDKTKAYMGEKVAINVVSANGFELDTLAVMDVSGKKNIELKNNVFEMPDEDVVIKATFKEIPGDEDPGTDIPKDIDESFGKYILIKQKMNVSDMFAATKEIYKDEPKVKFKYVIAGTDKAETKAMKKAASVTGKGLLKAKKAGFVNVTLQKRAKGEKKWTTVSSNSIRIVAPSFNTNDGKGKKFIATYIGQLADANLLLSLTDSKMTISGNACVNSLNENAEKITWSSKSKAVTVDEKGKITVNKTGSAVVKAVIEKEGYGKSTVSLKISVKIPKFAKAEYKVKAGKSVKLAIKNTVKGVNEVVSMTSDNAAIAVDMATKKVTVLDTAKSGDKAVITAVTTDGKSYSCNVIVK